MKLSLVIIFLLQTSFSIAQNYKSFKIYNSLYKFNLNKDQGGSSKFIEYDDERKVLKRLVERPTNAIETFSIQTGNMTSALTLNIEKAGAFKSLNANHFWVHDRLNRIYLLIDQDGKILSKIKEPDFNNELTYILNSSFQSAPIINYKEAIYVTGMILFKPQKKFDFDVYKRTGIIEKLNKKGGSSFIGSPTPLSLSNFYGNLNAYSLTLNKNIIIASAFFSDEIQLINLDNSSKKNFTLKTRYGSLIKPIARNAFDTKLSNFEKNQLAKNSYANIGMIYDKFKDVYYRFVRFPEKSMASVTYAIIVLDKNFAPIFETKVSSSTHNIGMYFITEKGLAIFNKQKYISDNTKMTFDLFSLI